MEKIILAAIAENNVIGYQGKMLWHIPDDIRHFRELTLGHPIIMGRKTYESIGNPLDNRINFVVTRNKKFKKQSQIQICNSLDEALGRAELCTDFRAAFQKRYKSQVYIIGGAEVYKQTIGLVDRLELTRVHQAFKGDALFPEINWNEWEQTNEQHFPGEEGMPAYSFESYKRL